MATTLDLSGKTVTLAAGEVSASELDATLDLSGKTVTLPAASVTAHVTAFDDNQLKEEIALLGFRTAANGSLAKYNLVDQTIDAFQDAAGVDASASTNEARNASDYYSGMADAPGDATGGTITYSGGNTIHSFTADGDFVAPSSGTIGDYLIVAGGGGGGGSYMGGGGGAGGILSGTAVAITAATYPIVIGDGGAGGASEEARGSDGETSSFNSLSPTGGGGGGSGSINTTARPGGSGGGGSGYAGVGAAGTSGQGNTGGNGGSYGAGGGGGAGAGGGNGGPVAGGDGGVGVSDSITGSAVYYGGGGGGAEYQNTWPGQGGNGGGGAGAGHSGTATAGTANTGGGGGGANGYGNGAGRNAGAAGGSGIVILSYTTDSFTAQASANLTLVSNATTAEAVPTKGDLVMTYTNGAGTTTVNTDLKAYASRDDGTTWTQLTLASQGSTGAHTILSAHDLDISGQPSGTDMRYKITTHNQSVTKETRVHAVSLGWS
jgi:hypothetical protein